MLNLRPRHVRRELARGLLLLRRGLQKLRPAGRPPEAPIAFGNALSLEQAVIVISGSSRGLGLGVARAFLERGATVVINGRDAEALATARRGLDRWRGRLTAVQADVATPEGARRLVQGALDAHSKVDVLINNAGVLGPPGARLWDLEPDALRSVVDGSAAAAFLCSSELLRWSSARGHPVRILNVSSGIVPFGQQGLGAYHVAKASLEGLTRALQADAGLRGPVAVASIRPRSVRTRLTKGFYPAVEYHAMPDPEDEAALFIHAATAPLEQVAGRSFSGSSYALDARAEFSLGAPLSAVRAWRFVPETPPGAEERPPAEADAAYMHLLQNPVPIYSKVREALLRHVETRGFCGYPDAAYAGLRAAIAERYALDPEGIAVGAGSSELLDRAIRTFAAPHGTLVVTRPTWGFVWSFLQRHGLRAEQVPHAGSLEGKDLRPDLDAILGRIDYDTRLVYLVNPCNPTGAVLDPLALERFLLAAPSHVTVVVDEAYYDYCEPAKRLSLAGLLGRLRCRAIGLRTFSKFYALSGFRVGFAYSTPEVIEYLNRLEVLLSVANLSQAAARAALLDTASQAHTYETNASERARISAAMDELEIPNMPSQTNFVLFRSPIDKAALRHTLQRESVYLPNIDQAFADNNALATVGLPEHNSKLLAFLARH